MSGPMQPPPGYNPTPQPKPQAYQQPAPPQYASGPMPPPGYPPYPPPGYYPPPQKSGFPIWVIFVILGVMAVPVLGVLALAAIPLIASNTQEARSSEARAALGAMKDRARVVYARTGSPQIDIMALNMSAEDLNGAYFTAGDYSVTSSNPLAWSAQCDRVFDRPPRELSVTANLINGHASFNR